MAIVLEWDDEAQTVIRIDFDSHWRWDEFRQVALQVVEMTRTPAEPVDVIFNVGSSATIPQREAIIHGQWVQSIWPHDRVAYVVVVTTKPLILALIQVFRRLFPDKMRELYTVDSLERARHILQAKHDD